jgi:3-hydroxyisobutyrate dehydrogenase-like beta-hydroxyacid dehydrogenase
MSKQEEREVKTVAVLGTGRMGGAIARRLRATGLQVVVWDRTKEKAEALDVGPVAESPADAVRRADVVLSILTDEKAVREVYLGAGGVFEAAAGKTLVEMSTAGPGIARELAAAAKLHGARWIEAPVLGSTPAVDAGTLIILAAASPLSDVEAARAVLERLGEVRAVGEPGNAAALKLVANSMLGILGAAAAELMAAGERAGLDPEQVFWTITRLAPGLKPREAGYVRKVHTPAMFAVRNMLKDLDLSLSLYQSSQKPGSKMPLTSLVRELFGKVALAAPELDLSAIINAYSKEAAS